MPVRPENRSKYPKEANLVALCQRCHLRYDAKHHASTARRTRARKAGQLEITIAFVGGEVKK